MSKKIKKLFRAIGWILAAIIVFTAAFSLWFYRTGESNLKNTLGKLLPLPAVSVEGRYVSVAEFNRRLASLAAYVAAKKEPLGTEAKKQLVSQLILEKKTEIIAKKHGVTVGAAQLEEQMQLLQQNRQAFEQTLKKYALTEQEFKTVVLSGQLLTNNLVVWFNSQRELNQKVYTVADNLTSQLQTGTPFETLAAQYSQDSTSKQTGGDLGFVAIRAIGYEFKEPLEKAKIGDIITLGSRFGIHLMKVEAKDNAGSQGEPRLKLRHILLKPESFSSWFEQETKNMNVRTFINL